MYKLTFIISLLLFFINVNGQKIDAVIQWNHTEPIYIYDSTLKLVIDTIQNDSINENYISLILIKSKRGAFKVNYKLEMEKTYEIGYLKKNNFIGAFVRHENYPTKTIDLFDKPKSKSNKKSYENWKPHFVSIKDFKNDWYKIEIHLRGSVLESNFSGWIQKDKLCPNNYIICD